MSPPGLTPAQRTQRQSLGYIDKASDAARRCDVCSFYIVARSESECGGCNLGLGPVSPAGTCNSFAEKT